MKDCNNCMYMTQSSSTHTKDGTCIEKTGFCHRYPPVLINPTVNDDYESNYESSNWVQPTVDLLIQPSWCGEFKH